MKRILVVLIAAVMAFASLSIAFAQEAQPCLGAWMSDTVTLDGQTMKASDFFICMKIVLNEDGSALFTEDVYSEPQAMTWYMEDGVCYLGAEGEFLTLTMPEAGKLVLVDMEGDQITFVPDDGSAPAEMSDEEAMAALMKLLAYAENSEDVGESDFEDEWDSEEWLWEETETDQEFAGQISEEMVGTWIEVDGYGTLELYADGTAVMTSYDGTVAEYHWGASGNNGKFLDGDLEGFYIELNNGALEVGGGWYCYTRDGAPVQVPTDQVPALDPEAGAPYMGLWQCDTLTVEGETVKAADYFITTSIELLEDGSAIFTEDEYSDPGVLAWYVEGDCVYIGNNEEILALEVDAEGQLVMTLDGDTATFVQVEKPDEAEKEEDPFADMSEEELLQLLQALLASENDPQQEVETGFATLEDRLEKKFVCTAFTSSGVHLTDVSMLGGEYAVTFHENGSCDFITAGVQLPGATWVYEQVAAGLTTREAFVIDYYGIKYNAVLTEKGFDLDNFGTVLHMELAE